MLKDLSSRIRSKKPEQLFLLVAVPFCIFFVFAIPALQGWDEAAHFTRAYQVSELNLRADKIGNNRYGGNVPTNIITMHDAFMNDLILSAKSSNRRSVSLAPYEHYGNVINPSAERLATNFTDSAIYSPVAYFPPAIGIAIARFMHLPLLTYIYMGRIFTMIAWLFLMYWAIKRIPVGKWVLVALGLLPTTITHAVSIAPDALLIGTASLLVAIFVDKLINRNRFTRNELLTVFILLLIIALTKQTYAIFAGLFLLLPLSSFGTRKAYLYVNALLILPILLLSMFWLAQIRPILQVGHIYQRPGLNVNPAKQVTYLEHHTLHYGAILGNSILTNNSDPNFVQVTGFLTWKGILLPYWAILISYFALLISFLTIKDEIGGIVKSVRISWWSRYGPLLLLAALVPAIYTSLYIGFNEVGSSSIAGVQGRYFLPLIPLLIPAFLSNRKRHWLRINTDYVAPIFVGLSIVVLLVASATVIATNYIPDLSIFT
jgi:uncharacterized membrane protein